MTESRAFGALILAGGRSSRMGEDKSRLIFQGRPLLAHMKALAGAAGGDPVLVSGGRSGDLPDPQDDAGPVSGLCALAHYLGQSRTEENIPRAWLVVPVDMPLLGPALLRRLTAAPARAAHFDQQPLPLALHFDDITSQAFSEFSAKLTQSAGVSILRVLEHLNAQVLVPSGQERAQLANANTPAEWRAINNE